ncbi:hypothetical protein CMO86_06315, partial [Candidatus Woesearchaeota archaeon]|nr:hypothetical protein [Candidatus Woesearchaeota archaeon]
MTAIGNFNDLDHISLTLNRSDTNHGLLVYRQESTGVGSPNINDAKLVGILGPKELAAATSGIQWKDYGVYEQTAWSSKGTKNEFTSDQIHFPNIATTGQRRGWALDEIVSIGAGSITLNTQYDFNATVGFGTDATVKVAHDNTYALKEAIDDTVVGILPVHLFGKSSELDQVLKIAKKYNLFIVEDVAQAFGSKYKDKHLG